MRAVVRGVAALLVALALLAAVPATELGTRWLAGLIDWWTGDRVSIGAVSGRLAGTVRLRQLEVRHQSLDLTAGQVTLSWVPAMLLGGEVHVTALEMNGVRLELHELSRGSRRGSCRSPWRSSWRRRPSPSRTSRSCGAARRSPSSRWNSRRS